MKNILLNKIQLRELIESKFESEEISSKLNGIGISIVKKIDSLIKKANPGSIEESQAYGNPSLVNPSARMTMNLSSENDTSPTKRKSIELKLKETQNKLANSPKSSRSYSVIDTEENNYHRTRVRNIPSSDVK